MTDREAVLARLREFAAQQRTADATADRGSLDRAADIMALYEERDPDDPTRRRWASEMPAPKRLVNRGRPVDPESFSRFTKWLRERVDLGGSQMYRLRDAHELTTTYFASGERNRPSGEFAVRPLKWMRKNGHGDRIPEVWKIAVRLAGGGSPDEPTVRKALSQWKHDNLPKAEHTSTRARGGKALVEHWITEAERIMAEYPELFAPALDRIMAEAEQLLDEAEAA